jgi:hypothetical protein
MTRLAPLACALLVAAALPAGAQQLRAYAGAVAGQVNGPGNCGTFGPSIPDWSAGLTLPLDGIAGCGVQGGEDNHVAAAGTVTASQSTHGPVPDGTYSGRAAARAAYGQLGVASQGLMTGGINGGGTLAQSASFASFSDRLTITSPQVAPGSALQARFQWTLDGSLSAVGVPPFTVFASVQLSTRVNGRNESPDFGLFQSNTPMPFYSPAPQFLQNGFSIGPGFATGSATVQSAFLYPLQADTAFTLEVALRDVLRPCCFGASAETSFLNTAQMSGIRLFDGFGQEITGFSISSASGTLYTRDGVLAVPEPGTAALALAGALWLLARVRRRLR